ncbi:MAG: deoxyguanosinetriphosphate triphosphohydrolase [Leptolinea sp.]|jgi:dGTPase|nr:deoxyguanosinetriphosphate triphosphohydrolase [Leptolinea sp.]
MLFSRETLEEQEDRNLAPYAIRSKDTRGRQFPQEEPPYRTCFQRDRDRILHTTAFRRLEYKTQVFFNFEGDYYRTRLTHTLEVTQIGRTMARALGANEDLVEAICLAHDLGHPPFGHSGESTLARLMKDHGGFDHNKHSLRIVTKLEKRYPDFDGLNLSWEVLEGIVKHETEYDRSDAEDFNPDLRGSLEAQITNAADEMAYTAHDLDDGLRSGMINEDMLSGIEIWEILLSTLGIKNGHLDDLTRHRIIRKLIGMEVTALVNQTAENLRQSSVASVEELQRLDHNVVGLDVEMIQRNRQLKDFLYRNLYRHYRVVRMSVKAENMLTSIFNTYIEEPSVLPNHIQLLISERGLHYAVCDYIAGMTDRFAVDEYQRLFNPEVLP